MEGKDELELVPLFARLFALGTLLLLHEGSARLMVRLDLPIPRTDLELLRRQLAQVPNTIDGPALYRTIVVSLVTFQSFLVKEPSLAKALPSYTELTPLRSAVDSGSFRGIGGRVHHWLRPASALAALRMERIEHAESHPPDPMPHPGIYLDRLSLYWDSDPQLPSVSQVPSSGKIGAFFRDSGEDVTCRRRFRLALCPLEGPFHPRFAVHEDGRFFQVQRVDPMAGAEALKAHLEAVVEAAVAQQVNLVVLPELTVDASARNDLRNALHGRPGTADPLYGVVAGSFHLWDAAGADVVSQASPVNETVLLDRTGAEVMFHRKKGRFRIAASKVGPTLFAGCEQQKLHKEIFEDIRYGSELRVLDTGLGRLAILICADAIAADDRGYLPLIRRLRPDLVLIVAMSDETEPFAACAEEMSRYWVGTVFVNAHRVLMEAHQAWAKREARPGADDTRALVAAWDLALYEAEGSASTRGRWRFGKEPECFYFKPCAGGSRGWRPLSRDPTISGISLLQHQDRSLGLVLDLGVHWREEG